MRVISTLIVSALALVVPTMVSAAPKPYPGIVLTSIDAIDIGNNKVEFSGDTAGDENDKTALVLKNVVEVRKQGIPGFRYPVFQGEKVNVSELKKSVKKPLLVVHGFSNQPQDVLANCLKNKDRFEKFDLIPVLWPSTKVNYWWARDYSKGAGEALWHSLRDFAGMFPRKSLMAHSMGNRVLRHAADGNFRFDNIFMCAADVNRKIFNKDYINGDSNDWRRQDGLRICKMLNNNKSRVYCLHNQQDYALTVSNGVKFGVPRLGAKGAEMDKLHPDIQGKVENVNCGQRWLNWGKNFAAHSYHWDKEAVEFYDSKCI